MSSSVDRSAPDGATLDLDAIRLRLAADHFDPEGSATSDTFTVLYDDVPALLAEVDRLRVELADARTALAVHSGAKASPTRVDWQAVTRALDALGDGGGS